MTLTPTSNSAHAVLVSPLPLDTVQMGNVHQSLIIRAMQPAPPAEQRIPNTAATNSLALRVPHTLSIGACFKRVQASHRPVLSVGGAAGPLPDTPYWEGPDIEFVLKLAAPEPWASGQRSRRPA